MRILRYACASKQTLCSVRGHMRAYIIRSIQSLRAEYESAGVSCTRASTYVYVASSHVAWRGVAWRGVAWRGVAWRRVASRRVASHHTACADADADADARRLAHAHLRSLTVRGGRRSRLGPAPPPRWPRRFRTRRRWERDYLKVSSV